MNDQRNHENKINYDAQQHSRHEQQNRPEHADHHGAPPDHEPHSHHDKQGKVEKHEPKPPVTDQDKLEKIRGIIEDNETPMVTTVTNGKAMSRPMKVQEAEYNGTLWFFTTKDTAKYDEIKAESRVNVAFGDGDYLSISGQGEFVEDPGMKKRLWNKWAGDFFDIEYDDPNLVLLKVKAQSAEYWEGTGKIKSIINFVKSLGGDEKAEEEVNSSIELKPMTTSNR